MTLVQVVRADLAEEKNGLELTDEPAAHQSDPAILELQLRSAPY